MHHFWYVKLWNAVHGISIIMFVYQSDGGSAVLLMEESKAKAMGYKPKAYLRFVNLATSIRLAD